MKANIVQVRGITFIGKTDSGHWVPMDGPEKFKGSDAAIRPKDLLLIALGGCSGSDVASLISKMREKVSRFEIDIEAEMAEDHPKVFTSIHLIYKFWGEDLNEDNLKKAIDLSQDRYCSVTAMLKKAVDIQYTYRVNPE